MTNKQKPLEQFVYVPADRYGVKGLIAIPLNEVSLMVETSPSQEDVVHSLWLKTGEFHGKN